MLVCEIKSPFSRTLNSLEGKKDRKKICGYCGATGVK
jgi:hypothetical protein